MERINTILVVVKIMVAVTTVKVIKHLKIKEESRLMVMISELVLDNQFDPDSWTVPVLPKERDNRGFIYVVQDLRYPKLIKIGKTQDFVKRVKQYNNDRPYEDVVPIICTRLLSNCDHIEKVILNDLIRNFDSVGKSNEWFPDSAMERIYEMLDNERDISYTLFNELWKDT